VTDFLCNQTSHSKTRYVIYNFTTVIWPDCACAGGQAGGRAGRLVPEYLGFPQSVPFHQASTHIFIIILLLSEGQAGEKWWPSRKQCCVAYQGIPGQWRMFSLFSVQTVKSYAANTFLHCMPTWRPRATRRQTRAELKLRRWQVKC
jgi:hypothetical protein